MHMWCILPYFLWIITFQNTAYVVFIARICMRYRKDLLSKTLCMCMQTSYSHIIAWYNRHFNPLFESGWHNEGECSSSSSDNEDTLVSIQLDIYPCLLYWQSVGFPLIHTGRQLTNGNSWTQHPSEKVLMIVNSLDFHKIMAGHCSSLKCLSKFDLQLIRACHIRYLSMSQAASHQWLHMMMENQPLHQRQYHIQHQVPLFLCKCLYASWYLCSVCADMPLWLPMEYQRIRWPQCHQDTTHWPTMH